MELNLHTIPIRDTAVLAKLISPAEESGDIVVPDSLPDIVRIVETNARIELRSKELRGGKLYAEASAVVHVIYVPETGSGLCRLAVTLPFASAFDLTDMNDPTMQTILTAELSEASARELNPRKITVRAAVNFRCTVYAAREVLLRTMVESNAAECLIETRCVRLIDGIYEKALSISDSVELPADLVGEPEIVKFETEIHLTERKQIKNKVVLKGDIAVSMLLLQDDEHCPLRSAEATVPFAGVIDCIGVEEETSLDIHCLLARADLKIVRESGTDRPLLAAKCELQTVIEAWSEQELSYVADAYGVPQPISCETEELTFAGAGEAIELRQSIREAINCGINIRRIYLCGVEIENAVICGGETGLTAAADGKISLTLEAEDGGIYALTKSIALSLPIETEAAEILSVAAVDKSYHISGGETVEVRFTAVLRLQSGGTETIRQICRMDTLPVETCDAPIPALTICAANPGETVWQLGKRMNARCAEIHSANMLTDEVLPADRLLLIPRAAGEKGRN